MVDDEESQRTALAGMVALWGYQVDTACDGIEALEKLESFGPHVLVTDMMMPRMDGAELLKQMKTQNSNVPAIVQTAFGNLETAVSTIHDLGAYWFLEKPVQSAELKLLLSRAALQGRRPSASRRW